MSRRREISDLLIPWRYSLRTSAALIAAVAGRPRRVPLCRAWSSPARTRSRRMSCSSAKKVFALLEQVSSQRAPAVLMPTNPKRSATDNSKDYSRKGAALKL